VVAIFHNDTSLTSNMTNSALHSINPWWHSCQLRCYENGMVIIIVTQKWIPSCGWFIYLPHFLWNECSLYFCTHLIIWTRHSWRSLHCNSKLYAYLIFMSQIYLYFHPVTNNSSTDLLTMFELNEDFNSFLNSFWKLEVLLTILVQLVVLHKFLPGFIPKPTN